MLLQLHWQHRTRLNDTVFVAQGEFQDSAEGATACKEWMGELIQRKGPECPDEYGPLLCDETSPLFVWAACP